MSQPIDLSQPPRVLSTPLDEPVDNFDLTGPLASPYEIGCFCAEQEQGNLHRAVFDTQSRQWLRATNTHWQVISWEEVRARITHQYIIPIIKAHDRLALNTDDTEKAKYIRQCANRIRAQVFSHIQFADAFRLLSSVTLKPPPLNEVATQDGILAIGEGQHQRRPFHPQIDSHLYAIPAYFSLDSSFACLLNDWITDPQEYEYFRCLMGLAFVGQMDRAYCCLLGPSGSGKTTVIEIMRSALGHLCFPINQQTFAPGQDHNASLCDLIEAQARFAVLPESQNATLKSELLNAVTGSDEITSRRPYGRGMISGTVSAFPLLVGEAPPKLVGISSGTLNRQIVIRFSKPPTQDISIKQKAHNGEYANSCLGWLVQAAEDVLLNRAIQGWNADQDMPDSLRDVGRDALEGQDATIAWLIENAFQVDGKTAAEILHIYKLYVPDSQLTAVGLGMRLSKLSDHFYMEREPVTRVRKWYQREK